MLNFYYSPISVFSHKVQYFLEEAGIPYKPHLINLMTHEQAGGAFRKVNPFGQVPAIEHDGFSMNESNAILRYLAARYEKTDWYPANLEDRALVDSLCEFTNLHINRWIMTLGWNLSMAPMMKLPVDAHAIEPARQALLRTLPKLEQHLLGRLYLAGSAPTLADAVLVPFMAMHKEAGLSLGDYPRIERWLGAMVQRPAWKKVQADAQKILAGLVK